MKFHAKDILIGHSLESDLKALKVSHIPCFFQVIDMKTLYFHVNLLTYKINNIEAKIQSLSCR